MSDSSEQVPEDDETGLVRRAWRGFNRWRRKYWAGRVLILLVIFSPMLYQYLSGNTMMGWLVDMGIHAIVSASEPGVTYGLDRYYEAREADRLQRMLKREFDRDDSGSLEGDEVERARDMGLNPEQLRVKCIEADLSHLVAAARRAGLVHESITAPRLKREALVRARGETRLLTEPYQEKIDRRLRKAVGWPNYRELKTWEKGGILFVSRLFQFFSPAGVAVFCLIPFAISAALSSRRRLVGGIVASVAGLLVCILLFVMDFSGGDYITVLAGNDDMLEILGPVLLYTGLGWGAARVGGRLSPNYTAALSAVCFLGIFFVVVPVLFTYLIGPVVWAFAVDEWPILQMVGHREAELPTWPMVAAGLLALGAVAGMVWLHWWRPRRERN